MRIFISFANEQSRVAESIYLKLLAADYEVFFASDDIRASDEYDERIRQEVAEADKLIFLASQESLTEGKFTLTELRMFSEKWPDPTGRVMTVMLNDLSYNDLPPYLGAVTSVFKAKGNIPSEVVATVVSQWPLRNKRWGLWGVIAASLVVLVVVFLFIKTTTPGRESENSVRGSEIPAPTPQIASQLDDATAIPTRTPSPTATPNPSPTFTHTPTPTATPTPVPSTTNTPTPTPLPTGSESIPPIEFNTGEEAITLTFHSHTLSRKDTFQIDPNKTVEYLKNSLIRHYKISIPKEFSDRNSDGGYDIEYVLVADHSTLRNDGLSLVEAGVKEFDVIELDCILTARETMACYIPDVVIVIEGIGSYNPEFTLNGHIPNRIEEKEDAYHFYFNYVGECNPTSWIGKLVLGDDIYFLVNPRDISENGTGKIMEFDFTGEGN